MLRDANEHGSTEMIGRLAETVGEVGSMSSSQRAYDNARREGETTFDKFPQGGQ